MATLLGLAQRAPQKDRDVTLKLGWGEALMLAGILERDRLARQKAGGSVLQVDRLIDRVETALFPRTRA